MRRNGSIRCHVALGMLCVPLFALSACDSAEQPSTSDAVVAVRDSQYRIAIESIPPDTPDAAGQLRVYVEPQNGWKIALEAPATLHLEETAGLEFNPEPDATDRSTSHLEFTRTFHANSTGDAVARGRLRFGICEGDESLCVVVQRELDLPVKVAFAEPE